MSYYIDGKRRYKHFPTRIEGDEFISSIGFDVAFPEMAVTPKDRVYWARVKVAAAGKSPAEAVDLLLEILRSQASEVKTLSEVRGAWLEDCQRRRVRPKTLEGYTDRSGYFVAGRESRPARELTPTDVIAWVRSRYSNRHSQRGAKAAVFTMMRWAAGEGRKWVGQMWLLPVQWDQSPQFPQGPASLPGGRRAV